MGLKGKLGFILLLIALLAFFPARVSAATVNDIAKQLICQCGCTAVLSNCTHGECMVRDTMTTLIGQKLSQGQSEAEIIQFFVAGYGEQVLASPPKRGFNLMAWVTPFAALLFGGGVVYLALKKWVRQGRPSPADTTAEADERDEQYRRQLEKELAEFGERSFR